MGIIKSAMGFGGVERVCERILGEIEQAHARGESEIWVEYTQHEIGIRANATQMAVFIRRRIEKAGYQVVDGSGGAYGEDVRLQVRCGGK